MPPPSPALRDVWARAVAQYPGLKERWGASIPLDVSGNVNTAALSDMMGAAQRRQPAPAPPPAPAPVPAPGQPPPAPTFPVEPPKPVDWGQRGKDIARMFGLDIEKLPGMGPDVEPTPELPEDTGLWSKFSTKYVEPVTTGFRAIDETVAPARGMTFGGWVPGLTSPGVQARSRALREQGFGPWAAAGAGYEQAVAAGEIPLWQRLPVEMVTDPVELVPQIGLGPMIAKTGLRVGARALGGRAAAAAVPKVAKEVAEEVAEVVPREAALEERYARALPASPEGIRAAAATPTGGVVTPEEISWAKAFPEGREAKGLQESLISLGNEPGNSLQATLTHHPLNKDIDAASDLVGPETGSPLRNIFTNLFHIKQQPSFHIESKQGKKYYKQWLDDAARLLTQKPEKLTPVPGVGILVTGFRDGASTKQLPGLASLTDNYVKPLSEYTDRLFHETNLDEARIDAEGNLDLMGRPVARPPLAGLREQELVASARARAEKAAGEAYERAKPPEGEITGFWAGKVFREITDEDALVAARMASNDVFRQFQRTTGIDVRRGLVRDWAKKTNPDGSVTYLRPLPTEAAAQAAPAAAPRAAEAVARPSILKGLSRKGPLETKYFTAFYVRSGLDRGWRIFRKTFDKRSDLHKDIEDAWREGRGGVEEWPKLTIGDEETGLVAQGLATRAEAMEAISRLEAQYIDEFLNPVQAARRQQLAVTPETVLPGIKSPLARIPLSILRERAKSTTNPRAFHYKNEIARRDAIAADKATVAAKRKEVEDYLGFYDKERGKVIDDLKGLLDDLPEDRQGTLNWLFVPDPNDPSRMIIRANRPMSPTSIGYKGVARGSATSTHINSGGLESGDILTGNESPWVGTLQADVASQKIIDEARESFVEMQTKDENFFQIAVRRFFGITNAQEQLLNEMLKQGSDELIGLGAGRRRFGIGPDRPLEMLPVKIGTSKEPGAIRILYRALHTTDGGKWLAQLAAFPDGKDWVRQYYNLRAFSGWEQNLRKLFDTDFKLLTEDDYFFRGWKRIEGWSLTDQQVAEVQQRLSRKSPITQKRAPLSFEEMEALGFEPIFWNPYHQAALSQRLGLNYRLQLQLIDILKNEDYGLARSAATREEREHLINEGYREVRGLGPAFDGDKITGTPAKFITSENARNAVQGGARGVEGLRGFAQAPEETTVFVNRYLFPTNVAKGIEDLFGVSRGALMRRQRALKGIPLVGKMLPDITYKYDDLVYFPKRAKLFASFFQQADFAQRAGFGGTGAFVYHVWLGLKLMAKEGERAKGVTEVLRSGSHLANLPKHWGNMLRANLSPGYRDTLKTRLRSKTSFFDAAAIKENPKLAEYTWKNLTAHGLHVNDSTIFGAEDAVETLREVVEEAKGLKRIVGVVPRAIRELEYMLRRGLFDGIYPAAIMHDVQYNILPVVRLAHPDLNPSQIMSIVARDANKVWSSIPVSQSVIQGNLREGGKRLAFSIAENEGVTRSLTGMFTSKENKAFFITRWAGGYLFLLGVANLIHYAHTKEHLPFDRFVPLDRDWDWWKFGYRQAFLAPDIPVTVSGGEKAMLDLVMQQDLAFRVADYSRGIPFENFVVSRLSVPARTALNQVSGKDYFGRDIDQWGFTQRMTQFAYDAFAPIGAGQLAILAAQRRFEDKDLPSAGPLLREGATIQDITPTIEARLGEGLLPHLLQGVGLNVRSKSNRDLLNLMTTNTFGGGTNKNFEGEVHTDWTELKNQPDKKREIYRDSANRAHVDEMERRRALGTRFDTHEDFTKMVNEERDIAKERLATEATVVSKTAGMLWSATDTTAWSPEAFRKALKKANVEFAAAKRQIEKTYGADPAIAKRIGERGDEPDDKGTMQWALWKYYNIRKDPKITDELGNVNYRAFDAAWEKEVAGWDPESGLEERLNSYLHSGEHHPFVQQYYTALEAIEKSGYWKEDFTAEIAALQGAYPEIRVQELWSEYLSASMEQRNALRSKANPRQRNAIRVLELTRKTHRLNTRYANPNIDALLVMWFHNSPATTQNLPLWQKLYKTAGNLAN